MAHGDVSKTIVHQIKAWFPACIDSPGVNMPWPAAGPGSGAVLVLWHAEREH